MHLAVYFDALDHFVAVGLQTAVEIVQLDPGATLRLGAHVVV